MRDKLSSFANLFFLSSFALQILLLMISINKLPPEVPLFYSRPWGEKILASPIYLFLLPAIALFSFVLDRFLANVFAKGDNFLGRAISAFVILTSFATLLGVVKIISLLT